MPPYSGSIREDCVGGVVCLEMPPHDEVDADAGCVGEVHAEAGDGGDGQAAAGGHQGHDRAGEAEAPERKLVDLAILHFFCRANLRAIP